MKKLSNLKNALWITLAVVTLSTSAVIVPNTVDYVDATHARLTWIALPESTYVNIGRYPPEQLTFVGPLDAGITNTLTLYGSYPQVYIIEEYKLVGNQLQLTRLWSSTTIPTGTETLTPTITPIPTETPIATPITPAMRPRVYIPQVNR